MFFSQETRFTSLESLTVMAATSTFVVSLPACLHHPATKLIETYKSMLTVRDVSDEVHEAEIASGIHVECEGHIGFGPGTRELPDGILIDWATPLDALKGLVEFFN